VAGLIVTDKWGKPQPSAFRKGDPPLHVGEKFGAWAGRDVSFLTLPGGQVLQFDLSRLTLSDYRGMRDHYQINVCLALLTFLVHQLDWRIECDGKAKIASQIEDNLRELWTPLVRGFAQSYWAGYSPMAIEYENAKSGYVEITKFKDLLPEECRVHWKKVDGYAPEGRAKPKLSVYDGIDQFGLPTIPVQQSVWYPLLMENGDHYGRKLLRPAFPSWFFSILIHLFANRYFERFGEPVPVGRAPFDDEIETSGGTINGRKAMEGILSQLRNRSVVVLPSDREMSSGGKSEYLYDIQYLESQMRGADFERYLTRLDEEISLGLFTPLLVTRTSDVGSYNLGVGHLQSYLWMLNALAGDFKFYLDNYVINRLKDINFGINAPRARFTFRAMGKSNVEILKSIVSSALQSSLIKPDVQELGQAVGMTFTEITQVTTPQPGPGDPTAPQPGDPKANPGDPKADPRVGSGRQRPKRGSGNPRGVGEPRATGRQVSARVASQVGKAFRDGTFGADFRPQFGYVRQMEDAFAKEGWSSTEAEQATAALYESVDRWFADAAGLGSTAFAGASDFMEKFDRVLNGEIDDLAA